MLWGHSSIVLGSSSLLLLRRLTHTLSLLRSLGHTLSILIFCNTDKLKIFQIFKFCFLFCLTILSLTPFSLLTFSYKQSGRDNHTFKTLLASAIYPASSLANTTCHKTVEHKHNQPTSWPLYNRITFLPVSSNMFLISF